MTVEADAITRAGAVPMTRAQIGQAMSGLYISIFVAILSSTIVTNALPTIVADLHAGKSVYTWVITATLLATTVSSPIWGKPADLFSKKLLIQISLIVFTAGSVLSGLVLQKTLPATKGSVRGDWAGAASLTAAASLLLVWVTFAGDGYAWLSWQSAAFVGGALLLSLAFVVAERHAKDPVLPLWLFRTRTVILAIAASLVIGVAIYAGSTYLSQYFQLSEGRTATLAGVLSLPLVLGLALASTVGGRIVTATGRWKPLLVAGTLLIAAGLALLGLTRHDTAELPAPLRTVIENAYGHATGDLFLSTVPLALIALVCVFLIREVPLRTSNAVREDGSR